MPLMAVLQSRAPGLACEEQQGLRGIKWTRGCSCLLLFSMTFQCSLKAEHRVKWAQLLLASHTSEELLQAWLPALVRPPALAHAGLCLKLRVGLPRERRAVPAMHTEQGLPHPWVCACKVGKEQGRAYQGPWVWGRGLWGRRRLAAWTSLARLPSHQSFGCLRRGQHGGTPLVGTSAPLPWCLRERGGSISASHSTSPLPDLGQLSVPRGSQEHL